MRPSLLLIGLCIPWDVLDWRMRWPQPSPFWHHRLFIRPGKSQGLFYKHCRHWLMDSVILFLQIFKTIRARDLKFSHNVHNLSHVMCRMSRVTCHVSPVTCHLSPVTCHKSKMFFKFFFVLKNKKKIKKNTSFRNKIYKVVELVGGGSFINGAYPI